MVTKDQIQPFIFPAIMVVLGLIVLVWIKNKISSATDSLDFSTSEEEKASDKSQIQQGTPVVTKSLSYPIAEYKNLANKIYNAMKGAGTDEDAIESVINMIKNQSDWNQVIKDFGIKDGNNLITWMRDDITESSRFAYDLSDIRKVLQLNNVNSNLP